MKIVTYVYKVLASHPAELDKRYDVYSMKVEILDEREKQYFVKFQGFHKDGRKPGSTTWVYKKSVRLATPKRVDLPAPGPRPDHYKDPYND